MTEDEAKELNVALNELDKAKSLVADLLNKHKA
jgi:hypothetical protein